MKYSLHFYPIAKEYVIDEAKSFSLVQREKQSPQVTDWVRFVDAQFYGTE